MRGDRILLILGICALMIVGLLYRVPTSFALQGEDLIPFRPFDIDGVHFTISDGPEGLFGFLQSKLQVIYLFQKLLLVLGFPAHNKTPSYCFCFISRPKRTFSVSESSPTSLRMGRGNFLIRVGRAMICSPFASLGYW